MNEWIDCKTFFIVNKITNETDYIHVNKFCDKYTWVKYDVAIDPKLIKSGKILARSHVFCNEVIINRSKLSTKLFNVEG